MNRYAALLAVLALVLAGCNEPASSGAGHPGDGHEEAHAGGDAHGPHGGRLLRVGEFALEVTVFESGVPPEFRLYASLGGEPLPPDQVTAEIETVRLGGEVTRFDLAPRQDYLVSDRPVREPHSFDLRIRAGYAGQTHTWEYASYEGRTTIPRATAEASGLETAEAGPAAIRETVEFTGAIRVIPGGIAHQRARFPGVIREVRVELNQRVEAGEVLATIQSNESLETYPLKAAMDGIVLQLDATPGEATGGEPLFVIANLSSVWAELDVFSRDLSRVEAGQPVTVRNLDGSHAGEGRIEMLSPVASRAAQSVRARVRLDNGEGRWRPGQFVRGEVTVAETEVPLAVKRRAVQRFRDFDVVYARVGETYEVRMLELGRQDGEHVEVLDGLAPGEIYVTRNSYLVKADLEKSGAAHDH